jgi:hypothetical protein
MAVTLALSQAPVAEAAPKKAATKTATKTPSKTNAKASGKTTTKKAASAKSGAAGTRKTAAACAPAPAKSKTAKTAKGRKRAAAACKPGTAKTTAGAAAAAAGGAAVADTAPPEAPTRGVHLPLMLRTMPSLPDSPASLQARLDSIVAAQGMAATDVQVSGVRQLAPDIYAFSLQCADAEQCQRLRLAIENERDWVAGLQLDERRNIPRPPERSSPAAR